MTRNRSHMVDASLAAARQDRYVLERKLGRGDMATAYVASEARVNRSTKALRKAESQCAPVLPGTRPS